MKTGITGISSVKSRTQRCVLSVLSFVITLLNKRSIITPGLVPEDYPKFFKWDAKVVQTGAQTKSKKRGRETRERKLGPSTFNHTVKLMVSVNEWHG